MNKLATIKQKLKNKKGFTLVEMIIVMVIMALLAAALIPTMMGYIQDAKNSAHVATARAFYLAAQSTATELSAKQDTLTDGNIITNNKYKKLVKDLPGDITAITLGPTGNIFQLSSITYTSDGTKKVVVTVTAGGEVTFP